MVRVDTLVLFLILEKKLKTIVCDVSYGFVLYGLCYVEVHSSIPNLLKVFIMKECRSLSDFFSEAIEMII